MYVSVWERGGGCDDDDHHHHHVVMIARRYDADVGVALCQILLYRKRTAEVMKAHKD
jgi:hypothetical protein